jgi:hypothetical protein
LDPSEAMMLLKHQRKRNMGKNKPTQQDSTRISEYPVNPFIVDFPIENCELPINNSLHLRLKTYQKDQETF